MSTTPPPPGDPWGEPTPPPGGYGPPPGGYDFRYEPTSAHPQGQSYPGYGHPAPWPPPAETSQKAIWALVCGLISLTMCCFPVGIAGVILGVKARRDVRESQGRLTGDGLATAGLVTGAIGTAISLAYVAFMVVAVWIDVATTT